jgi:hypothetical protein
MSNEYRHAPFSFSSSAWMTLPGATLSAKVRARSMLSLGGGGAAAAKSIPTELAIPQSEASITSFCISFNALFQLGQDESEGVDLSTQGTLDTRTSRRWSVNTNCQC